MLHVFNSEPIQSGWSVGSVSICCLPARIVSAKWQHFSENIENIVLSMSASSKNRWKKPRKTYENGLPYEKTIVFRENCEIALNYAEKIYSEFIESVSMQTSMLIQPRTSISKFWLACFPFTVGYTNCLSTKGYTTLCLCKIVMRKVYLRKLQLILLPSSLQPMNYSINF